MGGIAGWVSTRSRSEFAAHREADRLAELVASRGPDGRGVAIAREARIGFVHTRLAVIDPTPKADQPFIDPTSGSLLAYNGEIYNFKGLRNSLSSEGLFFDTNSDTEVILKGYLRWGCGFFNKLRGMYALAIFDPGRNEIILARDPLGLKPMYLSVSPEEVRFGSSPAAAAPEDKALDPGAAVSVAVFGAILEPYSPFKQVNQLAPGGVCRIELRAGRLRVRTTAQHPDFAWTSSPMRRPEHLEKVLAQSVTAHLTPDVPVAIFQSAGLDSTLLSALACKSGARPTLLTVGFEAFRGSLADEVPGATHVAKALGLPHRVRYFSETELQRIREQFLEEMVTPTSDAFNTYLAAHLAREAGFKVAISGVGGDELFAGYPSFRQLPSLNLLGAALSSSFGIRAAERGAGLVAKLAKRRSPKLRHAAAYLGDWGRRYLLRRAQYLPEELGDVLGADVIAEGLPRFWMAYQALAEHSRSRDQAGVRVLESDVYMRNVLLRDADWAGMAHGVEIRAPLVDLPLYRALCDRAHRCAYGKEDLRQIANRISPELQLRPRKKTGFMVPRGTATNQGDTELLFGARGLREWNRTVLRRWFGDWVL